MTWRRPLSSVNFCVRFTISHAFFSFDWTSAAGPGPRSARLNTHCWTAFGVAACGPAGNSHGVAQGFSARWSEGKRRMRHVGSRRLLGRAGCGSAAICVVLRASSCELCCAAAVGKAMPAAAAAAACCPARELAALLLAAAPCCRCTRCRAARTSPPGCQTRRRRRCERMRSTGDASSSYRWAAQGGL